MNFGRTTGRLAGGAMLLIALSLGAAVAMTPMQDRNIPSTGADGAKPERVQVQTDQPAPARDRLPATDEDGLRVGTYNPQMLFRQYHGLEGLREFVQGLEAEAMQAQQAGDQQKLMELQMRYQTRENQVVAEFEAELEKVLPDVARGADVRLVAVEIMFKDEGTTEVDLTGELAAKINAGAPQAPEQGGGADGDHRDGESDKPGSTAEDHPRPRSDHPQGDHPQR